MPEQIAEHEGRHLFGASAEAYQLARPAYPAAIFSSLTRHGALSAGCSILEIGAGSGLATQRLIEQGAGSMTLLEPDIGFTQMLRNLAGKSAIPVQLVLEPFEEAELGLDEFDLVVAATAFHWLEPRSRVQSITRVVKPGGHVALWWNVFQDPSLADPFHDATVHLLDTLARSPSDSDDVPFALRRSEREQEFIDTGEYELTVYREWNWKLQLTTQQIGQLYSGFSAISRLVEPARDRLLADLMDIADVEFGGAVTRNMTTPLYIFRRTPI